MQFGQVPVQYLPEPVVNDTRAVTIPPRGAEALAPVPGARGGEPVPIGTRPGEGAPVPIPEPARSEPPWLWIGVVIALLWHATRGRRS